MDALIDGLPVRPDGLLTSADASAVGREHQLSALHRSGVLVRIWPGVYWLPDGSEAGGPRADAVRYRLRVRAAAHRMPRRVFTSYSAAAILDLPIVGRWPEDVYLLAGGRNGSRRGRVRQVAHRLDVPEIIVDGVRVTAPEYTVIQLARHAPLRAALVAADAALRDLPYDDRPPLTTLERLRAEDERLRPYQGCARAAAVLKRASSLADHPLETISRLAIEELGFVVPELQQRFWLPGLGEYAWVDFYWPELEIGAEADGAGKYLDAGSAAGAARRVVREKRREEELRRQLHAFDRWGWEDAWQVYPLERILERLGVPRVRPRRRLIAT